MHSLAIIDGARIEVEGPRAYAAKVGRPLGCQNLKEKSSSSFSPPVVLLIVSQIGPTGETGLYTPTEAPCKTQAKALLTTAEIQQGHCRTPRHISGKSQNPGRMPLLPVFCPLAGISPLQGYGSTLQKHCHTGPVKHTVAD